MSASFSNELKETQGAEKRKKNLIPSTICVLLNLPNNLRRETVIMKQLKIKFITVLLNSINVIESIRTQDSSFAEGRDDKGILKGSAEEVCAID